MGVPAAHARSDPTHSLPPPTPPPLFSPLRGKHAYDNMAGKGYAQVAISTTDVFKAADAIKAAGGKVTREPGPVPGIGTKITATTDPDGWKVVLVDERDFLEELK